MSGNGHNPFWAPAIFVTLAFLVRFSPLLQRTGLDVYVHDGYRVFPLRVVGFWGLLGLAAIWFLTAAIRLNRHPS